MGYIPFVGFLVLLGVVVALGLLASSFIRFRPGPAEPSCGHCGYCVRGIPTFTCPECGSDLRQVGIAVPSLRLPTRLRNFTRVLIWTLLVPIPAMYLLNGVKASYAPTRTVFRQYGFITCSASYLPVRLQVLLEGSQSGVGRYINTRRDSMRIWLVGMGYTPGEPIIVDLTSGRYSLSNATNHSTTTGTALDAMALNRLLAAHGLDPASDPRIADRIKDFLVIIHGFATANQAAVQAFALPRTGPLGGRGRGMRGPLPPPPSTGPVVTAMVSPPGSFQEYTIWTHLFVYGLPALTWALGAYVIVRRNRTPQDDRST